MKWFLAVLLPLFIMVLLAPSLKVIGVPVTTLHLIVVLLAGFPLLVCCGIGVFK